MLQNRCRQFFWVPTWAWGLWVSGLCTLSCKRCCPFPGMVGRIESQCSLKVSVVAMGTVVAKGMASLQKRGVSRSIIGCCSLGWAWGQLGCALQSPACGEGRGSVRRLVQLSR